MKKIILLLISAVLFVFVPGCAADGQNEIEPDPPVITPSPTPLPTPEPEPECTHFWRRPTCLNPYVCLDCGETMGSPLGHIWTDANFQEPSKCQICEEVYGEPLEPRFLYYGFQINATAGRPYEYLTITSRDDSLTAIGVASLLFVDIFSSGENYPPKSGYEYVLGRFMITFDDDYARSHGFRYLSGQLDFYNFDLDEIALSFDLLRDSDYPDFKIASRTLNFYGEEFEYFFKHTELQREWVGDVVHLVFEYVFLVPIGYTGIVVYLSNAANWSEAPGRTLADNLDEDTLFFRLRQ